MFMNFLNKIQLVQKSLSEKIREPNLFGLLRMQGFFVYKSHSFEMYFYYNNYDS